MAWGTKRDAERSLYTARQGLVAVRLADELSLVTLFKALGGGAGATEEAGPSDA